MKYIFGNDVHEVPDFCPCRRSFLSSESFDFLINRHICLGPLSVELSLLDYIIGILPEWHEWKKMSQEEDKSLSNECGAYV